jgi:gliding motility-associated-like protein
VKIDSVNIAGKSEAIRSGVIRVIKGHTATLHASVIPGDANNKTVFWSSNNTKIVTVTDSLLTAKGVGEATVTTRTEDGNHTDNVQIVVYETVHAPQGFSPNNDGVNDYFELTLDSKETYTLSVFDRSGQVHYRSEKYENNWNAEANTGPHAGNKVPAGTYFYSLSAKNTGQTTTGFVVVKY